jgi:hypothetical protein
MTRQSASSTQLWQRAQSSLPTPPWAGTLTPPATSAHHNLTGTDAA